LLEALWTCGPLAPPRLIAEVKKRRDWGDATIKTLLARLKQKSAVRVDRSEGLLVYRALIEREAYLASEVDDLVGRLFHGDIAELERFIESRRTATM
jgi:BlaI family penicillinase repressor